MYVYKYVQPPQKFPGCIEIVLRARSLPAERGQIAANITAVENINVWKQLWCWLRNVHG